MKITALLSAGIVATALFASAAPAQERVVEHRNVRVVTTQRHVVDRRPGWNNHHVRRVCKVVYRHHQRIRQCRTVRY